MRIAQERAPRGTRAVRARLTRDRFAATLAADLSAPAFPAHLEPEFRASRIAALAELNGSVSHFGLSAAMVLLFNLWDRFVDPVHWKVALAIRLVAVAVILATGVVQRLSG